MTSPSVLITLVVLAVLWMQLAKSDSLDIGTFSIRGRQKSIAIGVVFGLILLYVAGSTIFYVLGFSKFGACVVTVVSQMLNVFFLYLFPAVTLHALMHSSVDAGSHSDLEMLTIPPK